MGEIDGHRIENVKKTYWIIGVVTVSVLSAAFMIESAKPPTPRTVRPLEEIKEYCRYVADKNIKEAASKDIYTTLPMWFSSCMADQKDVPEDLRKQYAEAEKVETAGNISREIVRRARKHQQYEPK